MKYWFESLIENGFDVATLVYIAILTIIYHYLLRWYISIKFNKINNWKVPVFSSNRSPSIIGRQKVKKCTNAFSALGETYRHTE